MEQLNNSIQEQVVITHPAEEVSSTIKPFIEANTIAAVYEDLKENHIIPVYVRDNEPLISQAEFIDVTQQAVHEVYAEERILKPVVRLSHPIKGRIPSARDKAAIELQEHEKTLYYERMAFVIEIPSIQSEVDGNLLSLVVGGVKAYNLDNMYARSECDEHFKVFIGFQNKVCTNLCVWTDGLQSDLRVRTARQLHVLVRGLFESYNANYQLFHMKQLAEYSITDQQFALLIGRCRMYPHLTRAMQADIPPLRFGDAQINSVVADYYRDKSFCRMDNGEINLWRVYNLLTSANKSSYIDSFLERSVSAYKLVEQIKSSLQHRTYNWFLS